MANCIDSSQSPEPGVARGLLANMGQYGSLLAGMIVLALTACNPGDDRPDEAEGSFAGSNDRGTGERSAFLGQVTYRYDRRLLTVVNVLTAVPPAEQSDIRAIKFVPTRSAEGSVDLCPGSAATCPLEDQPGVSIALLERPYDRYLAALEGSDLAESIDPVTIGGGEGVSVHLGEQDGLDTEYRIVPVEERALLLKLQSGPESAEELAAFERLIESIELES